VDLSVPITKISTIDTESKIIPESSLNEPLFKGLSISIMPKNFHKPLPNWSHSSRMENSRLELIFIRDWNKPQEDSKTFF
jgi:hypothetical protein